MVASFWVRDSTGETETDDPKRPEYWYMPKTILYSLHLYCPTLDRLDDDLQVCIFLESRINW